MTRFRRTRTFKVWLVDRAEIVRGAYRSRALPAVGETILVQKMKPDGEGVWRTTRAKPVPARVTRVAGAFITADINYDA